MTTLCTQGDKSHTVLSVATDKRTIAMLQDALRCHRNGRRWSGVDWTDKIIQQALRQLAAAVNSGQRNLFGSNIRSDFVDAFQQIDRNSDDDVSE